jgi:HK97 family phage major capsid protein
MQAAYRGGWKQSETFERDISQAASELFGYSGERLDADDPIVEEVGAGKNYRSVIWPKTRAEMADVLYAVGERAHAEEVDRIDMAIRAMAEGTSGGGLELVPTQFAQDRFAYVMTSTIAVRQVPGIQTMPVRSNVITLPRELTAAGASQANEAGTLTAQDAVLATQTINIRKQYGFRRYSNELLADADPAWNEFLANTLVRDVALSQDLQYLEGSGGAPQIQGLVGYTGLTSLSSGTNGASPDFDTFYDAQYALRLVNAEPDFIIAHPRVLNSLAKLKDSDGNYILSNRNGVNAPGAFGTGLPGAAPKGIVIEIPLWFSSQINIARTVGTSTNCTTVIIGRADQVLLLDRQGIEVAFSEHLYFNTDETAARAIARSAIAVITPIAVATIAGVKP